MAESKIMKCSCKHEFQDSVYGPGMRLFNPIGKGSVSGYTCTICGKQVSTSGSAVLTGKKK